MSHLECHEKNIEIIHVNFKQFLSVVGERGNSLNSHLTYLFGVFITVFSVQRNNSFSVKVEVDSTQFSNVSFAIVSLQLFIVIHCSILNVLQ